MTTTKVITSTERTLAARTSRPRAVQTFRCGLRVGTEAQAAASSVPVAGVPTEVVTSGNKAWTRGLASGTSDGDWTFYFQDFATVYNDMAVWPVTP